MTMIKPKISNLFSNWKLIISSTAAGCLFLSNSKIVFLACLLVVIITILLSLMFKDIYFNSDLPKPASIVAVLMAISMGLAGLFTIYKYSQSPKMEIIFRNIGIVLNAKITVLMLGIIAFIIALYFFNVVSSWFVYGLIYFLEQMGIPIQFDKNLWKINLRSNRYILISAFCFLCLPCNLSINSLFGSIFALLSIIFLLTQYNNVLLVINKKSGIKTRIFSVITAVGICLNAQAQFITSKNVNNIIYKLKFNYSFFEIVSVIFALISLLTVYIALLWFYNKLVEMLQEINVFGYFSGFLKIEKILYLILVLVFCVFIINCYTISNAFYSETQDYDIIFTSDSPELLRYNAYLSLGHSENDLRQPLFAVYTAPFIGIPYLIARIVGIFGNKIYFEAILIASTQAIILLVSYLLLAKLLSLTGVERIIFVLFNSATYTYLLFNIMIEQYIFAFFWLMLTLNCINEGKKNYFCIYGAGGTLTTSFVFLPAMSDTNIFKNLKEWIFDMFKLVFVYMGMLLLFGKFELLFNFSWKLSAYGSYMGKDISIIQIFRQFTSFIVGCFVSPSAAEMLNTNGQLSWQLNETICINGIGIGILFFAIAGCLYSWDLLSSKIMFVWISFSIIMLGILGWGASENGLILYALYFAWAYVGGIYKLLKYIAGKIKINYLPELIELIVSIPLLAMNIQGILKLLEFAKDYYPI